MDEGKHEGGNRMHATQCMPRLRRPPTATLSPLLQRFRQAVFKIVMLSAFSRRSRTSSKRPSISGIGGRSDAVRHADSYHRKEAVEDCIEFFKRSSGKTPARSSGVVERL